jgi:DUF1365 family protein
VTPHSFSYGLDQVFLDLSELGTVFSKRWLWSVERWNVMSYRRRDYLGHPAVPLDTAVRDEVESQTGRRPNGPIRLLTHLRAFGLSFNPVSFYFCYAADGKTLDAIVAEITNTPWRERHRYVLPVDKRPESEMRFRFRKAFHISPFQPMERSYDWRFSMPGERLSIHMQSFEGESRTFEATLLLERRPLTGKALAGSLLRHPWISAEVLWGVYSQAARLWWKGASRFAHPRKRVVQMEGGTR